MDALETTFQLDPRQLWAYHLWVRLHLDRRPRFRDEGNLLSALDAIANSPDVGKLWAQVALAIGHQTLEGPSDRVTAYIQQAIAMDPVFSGLYESLALVYEERLEGRRALESWYRNRYASSPDADTYLARAHIDWLLQTRIEHPLNGTRVSGAVEVAGTAKQDDFQFYKLEYRPIGSADDWVTIGEAVYQPVEHDQLLIWRTQSLPPGEYRLRLTVVDVTGNYGPHDEITVRVVGSGR
jgi:hypothetical protein